MTKEIETKAVKVLGALGAFINAQLLENGKNTDWQEGDFARYVHVTRFGNVESNIVEIKRVDVDEAGKIKNIVGKDFTDGEEKAFPPGLVFRMREKWAAEVLRQVLTLQRAIESGNC